MNRIVFAKIMCIVQYIDPLLNPHLSNNSRDQMINFNEMSGMGNETDF